MLDSLGMQLHLGILNERLQSIKGKMQAALMEKERMGVSQATGQPLPNVDKDKVEKDKELLELEFKALTKKYEEGQAEFDTYADKVLELTKL